MVNLISPSATSLPASSPLLTLQQEFAIIDLSGEIRVINRKQVHQLLYGTGIGELAFYKKADAAIVMRRHLENQPFQCNPRQTIEDFWSSPATVMYDATAFTPETTSATTLNFWVGPAPVAAPGNWVLVRDFLCDIICAGDMSSFDYLIRFMAHMVQKPEEKPGIMITLLGGQGTGKGVYFSLLRALWPRTTLQVSDIENVTGRFNACLERNFIICMDEALFAGDRKAMDRLKSISTESVLQIEQKYQPTRSIHSVHRLFASSNHSHFGNVEMDDRRFVFLQVSNLKQQDTSYFGVLVAAINDPATMGALLYYLQRKNLKGFDVRKKPNTREHLSQKLKSLQGVDRYWYEVLVTGHLNGTGEVVGLFQTKKDIEWSGPVFVPTYSLVQMYRDFNRAAQKHQTVQAAEVTSCIQRLSPSAQMSRQTWTAPGSNNGSQKRGLNLPDLATARTDFERVVGGSVQW